MTDKTDIAALTRPVRDRYDWSNAVWRDCDQCGKQHTGTVTSEDGSQICAHCVDQLYWSAWQVLAERALDQLEAERQQRDAAEKDSGELEQSLNVANAATQAWKQRAKAAEEELTELKASKAIHCQQAVRAALDMSMRGEQVPVAWTDAEELRGMEKDGCGYLFKVDPANPFTDPRRQIMLFDSQQKPVISKEKLCDWLEDNFDIDDSQRAAFAACFAHCCDCIVQSDSSAPVGEIVAWAGTDHEKGITREVDFRFLRFDVLPGTKLYALKPAPAILTDVLTAIRVGDSPTELIEALTTIKPKFGAPGSRDVDVRAANLAIDKAIEKLSNL